MIGGKLKISLIGICFCITMNSCSSQIKANPCDPPPPCLPPLKQYFGFTFTYKNKNRSILPLILADSDKANSKNNTITTILVNREKRIYRVTFLNPEQLNWQSEDTFQSFLDMGAGKLDTLFFKIKVEQIDCCPQLIIKELSLNQEVICSPCSLDQPIKFKKK
ncbi:MAG: hypothetical protein SFU99_22655 [Saprospiraceae bacterium]|nr:hypothetical protein [Saprospiraceae bacterium]